MNYLISFAICAAMTALGANESNAQQLLSCDVNVALFLVLAWYLGRRKSTDRVADLEGECAALRAEVAELVEARDTRVSERLAVLDSYAGLVELIRDDAYATCFQSMGQYRSALISASADCGGSQ